MDEVSHKVLIIVDDFRMGGIQRLALDQAYKLSDLDIKSEILVLSPAPNSDISTFAKAESSLILNRKIRITYSIGNRLSQILSLKKLIKEIGYNIIVAHSLRGAVAVKILSLLRVLECRVIIVIHQLPSLSAPIQRTRRFVYSQFSDLLYSYSQAVVNDWEFRRRRNALIWALTLRKSMSICRNGIYLERLVELNAGVVSNFQKSFDSNPRLVFIGRLASWKGLAKFIEIASMEELSAFDILLVTPSLPVEFIELLETRFGKRASIEIGKSISQIDFFATDLHLVPLNYGKNAVFIESISLTVLEMACMGIRSIISEGGNSTWPELKELGFVIEADWDNPISTANKILTLKSSIEEHKILEVRNLIDIKNNLSILLR